MIKLLQDKSKTLAFLILLICIKLFSCTNTKHNKTEIETALNHYDNLILKLDADSISLLYAPDGNLGDIAMGRDSIRRFLSSFKNVRVLSQQSVSESVMLSKDTATQTGRYTQTDIIGEKDTVKVKGTFIVKWQWIYREGWRIKHMTTKQAN